MKCNALCGCLFFWMVSANAQTLGSSAVFSFIKLPNTPQLTALGGINISQPSNDVGMPFNNPALLTAAMHAQMNAVFNSFYAGIHVYHLSLGYHHEKLKTNFLWGLNYFDYGSIQQTDASGNIYGQFRPKDWVMQLSASRNYMERWTYGATVKFINSDYGQYRSNGVAMDVGVLYADTANGLSISMVAKNMGTQLKKYENTSPDDLPFDLQLGVTKRLRNAPFSFSVTGHHLHHFDIQYNDTVFNNDNGYSNGSAKQFSFDKLFMHIILASTVYIGNKIEATVGYNFLRRKELSIGNSLNGVNGFSMGVGVILEKLQIRYGRAWYQNNTANNQLGLNLTLNKYFGLKKFGERIGW